MDLTTVVIVAVVVVVILLGVSTYNALTTGRLKVREGWSGIQVQLQRRSSLIPNLVETVKGYAAHERQTLESVTRARSLLQSATTPAEASAANNQLTETLRTLFSVAEAYPELKADANFRDLQAQLADTEDKIAYARTYYNALVLDYNTKVTTIPSALVANAFGFAAEQFFEAPPAATQEVKVSFS
ncbi:MAG TPA: LemA family protein [Chloroflexota bacterium]|nr:LemA family protein [Chloroflexota bacterium]